MLYWIVHFYLDFVYASLEWYSNNQNYEVKQGRKLFLQTPKSKIDKNQSYAILIVEHPLDPPVCINTHTFLMYTWSGSCILITYQNL
jgi:hypothetical protein